MKTHSNRIEKELEKLVLVSSTMQNSMNLISKAKKKIGKDMLEKMVNDTDELRIIVSKVEVAAEEDKLQIENAFSIYDYAVQSYETQLDDLRKKMKLVKDELSEASSKRMENTKKTKQAEMDLQAKITSLTLRLSSLQREHEEYKQNIESQDNGSLNSIVTRDACDTINLAPSDEIAVVEDLGQSQENKASETPPTRTEYKIPVRRPEKKKWKMKVQHGITKGEVEVNLREGDEYTGVSMISTRNDLITSYRSLERSVIESVTEGSITKNEEIPQVEVDNIVGNTIGSIESSIKDEESFCDDTSRSSHGSMSGLHVPAGSQASQHETSNTIDESIMHNDSLKDSNNSDASESNQSNDISYHSLQETTGDLSKMVTRSASDSGIVQSRGEDTNESRISQAINHMNYMGGDSMILQNLGEESINDSIVSNTDSTSHKDLSGVMRARGEDSLEIIGVGNEGLQDESACDSTIQGHSYDFSYDDTTQRSV